MDTLSAPACPGHRGCGSKHSHRVWAGAQSAGRPARLGQTGGQQAWFPEPSAGDFLPGALTWNVREGDRVEVTHLPADSCWTGLETHSRVAWRRTLGAAQRDLAGDGDGECGWGSRVPLLHLVPCHGLLWVPLEPPAVPLWEGCGCCWLRATQSLRIYGAGQAGVHPRKESAGGKPWEPPPALALLPSPTQAPPSAPNSSGGFSKCNTGYPVKFEFQRNNEQGFRVRMSQMLRGCF